MFRCCRGFATTETMATTEYSLTVPVDLVKRTKGLAMDIGGSVVKIVYRSKENLEEAESNTNGVEGHLQLVSFPKSKLTEALEYIQYRTNITRSGTEDKPEIFTTGVGCAYLGKTISETLNIRMNNVVEFDCFVKAFIYLTSQLSRKDCLEPRDLEVIRLAETEMMAEMAVYAKIQEQDPTGGFSELSFNLNDCQQVSNGESYSPDRPIAECEDIYPCILAVCGSGIAYIQINADKSFKVLDISLRGGRALHGLGTLLTGCKNFEDFLELASHGNPGKVGIYTDDLLLMKDEIMDGDESLYTMGSEIKHSSLVYSFGKAVGAKMDDFRPEDLAISWLNHFVLDIVQCLTLVAQLNGIKRLFFCGSICNSHLVRSILTKEMTRRIMLLSIFDPKKTEGTRFDFLKSGPHLGALGALITDLEKMTEDNSITHL